MATATAPMNDDDDTPPVMPLYLANDAYYPEASAPPDEPIYQSQQPSAPPLLPPGGEELKEPSGRIYYGNPTLQIVQYDLPGEQMVVNEFGNIEKEIENAFDDVDLALTTLEIEDLIGDIEHELTIINNMDKNKCDKQCEEANNMVAQNTVENFFEKEISQIFNK
jgi:hypothetical protein